MSDLPDDCIREILLRMTDHKDIVNMGATESRANELSEEKSLWRDLCLFHFDNIQINTLLKPGQNLETFTTEEWKQLYKRLIKLVNSSLIVHSFYHNLTHKPTVTKTPSWVVIYAELIWIKNFVNKDQLDEKKNLKNWNSNV